MKVFNQKNLNPLAITAIICAVILVVLIIVAAVLTLKGQSAGSSDDLNWSGESTAPLQELKIETDYGNFLLSGHWNGVIRAEIVESDSYAIIVYGKLDTKQEQRLFEIHFGGDQGDTVGYLPAEDGDYVAVNVVTAELSFDDSWTQIEIAQLQGMQDEINSILSRLDLKTEGEREEPTVAGAILVSTPYGKLSYPDTWENRFRAEVSGTEVTTVRFYGVPVGMDEIYLFAIVFGSDEEDEIGYLKMQDGSLVTVCVVVNEDIPEKNLPEETRIELYAMLDAVNAVLESLQEGGNFIIN